MKLNVDISLFCNDSGSIGRIHGAVNLPCAPFIGSSISFSFPAAKASFPVVEGFSGLVQISSIQFAANNETDGILVLLDDIVVPTREDGLKLAKYLLDGFGLYLDEND